MSNKQRTLTLRPIRLIETANKLFCRLLFEKNVKVKFGGGL